MSSDFSIRLAQRTDVPAMLDIYSPFIHNSHTSFELQVPDESEFWARVEKVLSQAPWLVCTHEDRVIGYAYAGEHRARHAYQWNRELSAYIGDGWRGKGIATALYTTLIAQIQLQGFANALAGISLPNEASVAFHERMGFQLVGIYHNIGFKMNRFWDVGWWEMPIREEEPGEILSLELARQEPEWQEAIDRGMVKLAAK